LILTFCADNFGNTIKQSKKKDF